MSPRLWSILVQVVLVYAVVRLGYQVIKDELDDRRWWKQKRKPLERQARGKS